MKKFQTKFGGIRRKNNPRYKKIKRNGRFVYVLRKKTIKKTKFGFKTPESNFNHIRDFFNNFTLAKSGILNFKKFLEKGYLAGKLNEQIFNIRIKKTVHEVVVDSYKIIFGGNGKRLFSPEDKRNLRNDIDSFEPGYFVDLWNKAKDTRFMWWNIADAHFEDEEEENLYAAPVFDGT